MCVSCASYRAFCNAAGSDHAHAHGHTGGWDIREVEEVEGFKGRSGLGYGKEGQVWVCIWGVEGADLGKGDDERTARKNAGSTERRE